MTVAFKKSIPPRWSQKTKDWLEHHYPPKSGKTPSDGVLFSMFYILNNGHEDTTQAITARAATQNIEVIPVHKVHAMKMLGIKGIYGSKKETSNRGPKGPKTRAQAKTLGPKSTSTMISRANNSLALIQSLVSESSSLRRRAKLIDDLVEELSPTS